MLYNASFFVCFKRPILYHFCEQIMHLTVDHNGAALFLLKQAQIDVKANTYS